MDDINQEAGFLDSAGFTGGVFYRYVALDVEQLREKMQFSDEEPQEVIRAFTIALYWAVPGGKQHSMTSFMQWDYARVLVRSGQCMQANFERPVRATPAGLLEPSIERLNELLTRSELLAGAFYGKVADLTFGAEKLQSIADFAQELSQKAVLKA